MKIEYRKGDLFSTDIYTIIHGCNAQGVMGSGVAKIVREQFPYAYDEYVERHSETGLILGDFICVPATNIVTKEQKMIVHAITQNLFGKDEQRYVSYDAVAEAMYNINRQWKNHSTETHVAMPQIGAGLGGGDWRVIEAIIESEMTDIQPVVYVL
jgi:O-acetyl-ADP-ribose deacetylase (regulator of RNase III)